VKMKKNYFLILVLIIAVIFTFSINVLAKETIEIWHWETPPHRITAQEALFSRFEKETGIEVKQVPINFPNYQSKIMAGIAANSLPDLLLINPPQLMDMIKHDAIIPVDDIFNSIHKKYEFPEALWTAYNYMGKQYGLPVYGVSWPLTYRADLYEEAGLEPPKTWDDLLEAAEKLTMDRDGDGETDIYGFCLPVSTIGNYGSQVVWGFLRTNDGKITDLSSGEQRIVFDSPETRETYEFLSKLAKYTVPGAGNMDWGMAELLIKSGKVATVMYNGAWLRELDEKDPELASKYKMTFMPIPEGGQRKNTGYPRGILITKRAEETGHLEAVRTFLEWLYKPENHTEYLMMEAGLFMPVTKATAESDTFNNYPIIKKYNDLMQVQAKTMEYISLIGFEGGGKSLEAGAIEGSFLLGAVLQKIVNENWSVEKAVEWGQSEYEKIVEY